MQYTKAQLARIWLRCAPIGAWRRLDKLKEKLGSAEHVWDCFTPVYYHEIGPEYFAQLADLRAEKLRSVLQAMDAFQLRAVFLGDDQLYAYFVSGRMISLPSAVSIYLAESNSAPACQSARRSPSM